MAEARKADAKKADTNEDEAKPKPKVKEAASPEATLDREPLEGAKGYGALEGANAPYAHGKDT
jgi:hypothetical protein